MTARRGITLGVGLAIVGGIAYLVVWPMVSGGPRMKSFCGSVVAGMTVEEVRGLAGQRGYQLMTPPPGGEPIALVIDKRAMGRFLCTVTLERDRVASARFVHND